MTLIAHYDGRVLVPETPPDLPVNQRLKLTVEPAAGAVAQTEPPAGARSELVRFLDELHARKHIRVGERPTRERTYADNPRLR